jgi:ankyrin repeat protein
MLRAAVIALGAYLASPAAWAGGTLFDAVQAGDAAVVEKLLAEGSAADARARDQATPLIVAALNGDVAIVRLLLDKGADVMARNSGGFTALHAAAYSGGVPVAELLLKKGAALEDTANKAGATPLTVASQENRIAVAELLIAKGADVNRPEGRGYTPLTRAFWRRHAELALMLKRHGAKCQPAEIMGNEEWYRQCLEIGK